ncbi:MAG: hypothetical protein GYA34_00910 [Chloroflexi bacterium]|nr:hypothetical protein [Chloroflexota bacterium]
MQTKTQRIAFIVLCFSFFLFSCKFVSNIFNRTSTTEENPPIEEEVSDESITPQFSDIKFCEDVTDDGECINPTDQFTSGTNTVWAFFTYNGMQNGMSWGRLWTQNDEPYVEALDEIWENGESGWLAFSISDDVPLSGDFTFSILIDNEVIQEASFSVAKAQIQDFGGSAAFGSIQFATAVDEENGIPINVSVQFTEGITEVYASFVYLNMITGQPWSREWLLNGEELVQKDETWEEAEGDGVSYAAFVEEDGLDIGQYTLNLYVDGQLARSANFEVIAKPTETTTEKTTHSVEELVDPDLMKAWELLSNSNNELLWRLADLVTSFQIEIRMSDDLSENTSAAYSYSLSTCDIIEQGKRQPGIVYVNRQKWNEDSWEEVAASIAHELTHAYQHLQTGYRCDDCSIQKEYEAFFVTIYALEELGAWDIIEEEYPSVVDSQGNIDGDTLWDAIKETYSECPEY